MSLNFNQTITPSDWVKIIVLLVIAVIAWYEVFSLYSQPFDLTDQIRQQQLRQDYEAQTADPIGELGR